MVEGKSGLGWFKLTEVNFNRFQGVSRGRAGNDGQRKRAAIIEEGQYRNGILGSISSRRRSTLQPGIGEFCHSVVFVRW